MADKLVTVESFSQPFEAERAKELLTRAGVQAVLMGDPHTDALWYVPRPLSGRHLIQLQVLERDAQRAVRILAEHEAALDEDWEDQAEHDPDVWVCSLCDAPVSNRLATCSACQTPREGIRADLPPSPRNVQRPPAPPPEGPVQKRDEVTPDTPT